jgi:chromosome segregation protein
MFLKKLEINGFKSFADHSEISFVKGISAIVGPNGCGKSNIVDAIMWVIGEQKTKMLRANSMVDVIFKGTEDRKGLGRAEVVLTLVNDKNILPPEYDEFEISRVIYADGENEYYINKKRVRLKDIQELFFDTGVGKPAYSVMAQGKIDMILSNKAEDRRFLIEEAAGITKYKVKRYESMARLAQTNDNIIRIKDIIEEVKSQYDHMKMQAEKAVKYKELHEKEIKLEIEINLNRIKKQKKVEEDLNVKFEDATKELEEIKKYLDSLETGVEEQIKNLTEYENIKIENQREIFRIQSDIKILNSKKDILKEQKEQYDLNITNDSKRVANLENSIKELDEEFQKIDNVKSELDGKIEKLSQDNEFYIENIRNLDEEIKSSNNEIERLKNEINLSQDELDKKRQEHKEVSEKLIVKIDQSLNIFDVNAKEILNFKNALNENIGYILEHLPQKSAFIQDIIRGGHISKDSNELLNMLNRLYDELKIIEDKVVLTDQNIKGYMRTTEVFLNDIFGPEGILQNKRKIEHAIDEFTEKIRIDTINIENLRQEIVKKRDKKEEFNKILHELNINLTTLKEKKNSIDNDIKRLLSMKAHHESNRDELSQKIEFYNKKIGEINGELQAIEDKINEDNAKKQELENQLVDIDKKIKDENANLSSQQQDIKDISTKWMNKKTQVESINIKLAEAKTTITNIYDNFYENYSINLAEHENNEEFAGNREYEIVKNELNEVKTKKHSLGSVNLMAIEESKTLGERYKLLTEQLDDLEVAKKDIEKMMEKINKTSEEMFLNTFNEIKANFHKLFKKLFDGGNADITLTTPDNLLETGIDIIAHPPGQKTQSITLLSGGQRTMTAIALMFATFMVRPSTFCLLDEIDAALDENNIDQFIKLITEMKETSQFIIITHNKKTISAADVMYGVTQEEKGISKIVSTKISEKTE